MSVPYLDVRAGHLELKAELQLAFDRVMASGQYVLGAELECFEQEFARYCHSRDAIGVGNGLDALTILLRASGIGEGDEVIVPAHTFIATWLAVAQVNAKIVPVDVEPDLLLIDPDAAAAACTPRTAAVIAVHLYGRPVDPSPLETLAQRHGLLLVGDAAQAHGARAAGRPVGTIGAGAGFSFYPSKNLGALGDGGAITTSDSALAASARRIRNYGSEGKNDFVQIGVNSRLDPLQAAFLRVKLKVLDEWNARRADRAERYLDELAAVKPLGLPRRPEAGTVHAWHAFCVRHQRRNELKAHLDGCGIQTLVHYPVPPHLAAPFADLGYAMGSFPVAERAAATVLSLPIGPHQTEDSIARVIEAVLAFCR